MVVSIQLHYVKWNSCGGFNTELLQKWHLFVYSDTIMALYNINNWWGIMLYDAFMLEIE